MTLPYLRIHLKLVKLWISQKRKLAYLFWKYINRKQTWWLLTEKIAISLRYNTKYVVTPIIKWRGDLQRKLEQGGKWRKQTVTWTKYEDAGILHLFCENFVWLYQERTKMLMWFKNIQKLLDLPSIFLLIF